MVECIANSIKNSIKEENIMSIQYYDYPGETDTNYIFKIWNEISLMETGEEIAITWSNRMPSDNDPREFVKNVLEAKSGCQAMHYMCMEHSKTYHNYLDRCQCLMNKIDKLNASIHYEHAASKFISCKNCGSKIATEYFGKTVANCCPICNNDLRPKSITDRLDKLKKDYDAVIEKLRKEEEKEKKKAKIKWLVKIEM